MECGGESAIANLGRALRGGGRAALNARPATSLFLWVSGGAVLLEAVGSYASDLCLATWGATPAFLPCWSPLVHSGSLRIRQQGVCVCPPPP